MTTVSTARIVAEITGEGRAVVLIHGLGGSSNTWTPQLPALGQRRAVRVDLPGSARSPVPHEPPTIESFAADVAAAVRTLGVERAHFVGHSLGTLVCQRIAVDDPSLVQSLALFGALTEPPDAARTGLVNRARTARGGDLAGIADQIAANAVAARSRETNPVITAFVRESVMRQSPEGYAKACEALAAATTVDVRLISVPTLLMTGEADVVAPPAMARTLGDRISGASVTIVPDCGHWITVEKPEIVNRALGEFLNRAER